MVAGDDYTPKRQQVRLDRYAIFDLGRKHHLSDRARWVLVTLCMLADFRSRTWKGSYTELREYTAIGRNTIPQIINELTEAGLVEVRKPFGPNREGLLAIDEWDLLIVPTARELAGKAANRPIAHCGPSADKERRIRRPFAEISANDQPEAPEVREQGRKEAGKRETGALQTHEFAGGARPVREDETAREEGPRWAALAEPLSESGIMRCLVAAFPGLKEGDKEPLDPISRVAAIPQPCPCGSELPTRATAGAFDCKQCEPF